MRLAAFFIAAVFLAAPAFGIDTEDAFSDPEKQARYQALTRELRCLVCQNQPISDSNAFLAKDLRRQVKDMIEEGATDDEIKIYMESRYGGFVLYKPRLTKATIAIWALPFVLLIAGAWIFVNLVRRKSALPIDDDPEDGSAENAA